MRMRATARVVTTVLMLPLLAACAQPEAGGVSARPTAGVPIAATDRRSSSTGAVGTPSPSPPAAQRSLPPRFLGTVSTIPADLAGSMRGRTWHPGCPVPLRDLRLSVTDRCNFRCTYCMPKEVLGRDYVFLDRAGILTFEEMTRLAGIFIGVGVEKRFRFHQWPPG